MRTRTEVVVGAGAMLRRVDSRPPLTIRRVHSDHPDVCALCLVGTAAGPLDGDDLELCLQLEPSAQATLTATGASLAQGGSSSYRTTVRLGAASSLRGRPGALIISAGSHVDVGVDLQVGAGAALDWRETVVLGRSAEAPGTATLRWDVTSDGRPVLRQSVDLRADAWRGVLDGARVLATALVTGPDVKARTVVLSSTAVAARLGENTFLATVLAGDAATAHRELELLCRGGRD